MAHLNVQERRVETKIAYVGPARSGKTTNLEQLGKREGATAFERTDDLVSLSYRSREDGAARFRDCDVMVNVVAPRTSFCTLTPADAESMFRGVDGVVLVLDADPSSRETNRTAAQVVRSALAAAPTRVPVVVQVNKSDLPGAVTTDVIAADLGESWPMVAATATRGEGVVETIERTLADVVEVLRGEANEQAHDDQVDASGTRESGTRPVRVEGNPLLHALRQLLRDTVSDKVHELEVELTRNLTDSFARAMKIAVSEAMTETMTPTVVRPLAELRTMAEGTKKSVLEMRTFFGGALQEITRALAVQSGELAELHARIDRLEKSGKDSAKESREHLVTILTGVRRSLDAIASDARTFDARKQVDDALAAVRALDQRIAAVDAQIRAARDDARGSEGRSGASLAKLGEVTVDVHLQVTELVDELKKRKKGWFT